MCRARGDVTFDGLYPGEATTVCRVAVNVLLFIDQKKKCWNILKDNAPMHHTPVVQCTTCRCVYNAKILLQNAPRPSPTSYCCSRQKYKRLAWSIHHLRSGDTSVSNRFDTIVHIVRTARWYYGQHSILHPGVSAPGRVRERANNQKHGVGWL